MYIYIYIYIYNMYIYICMCVHVCVYIYIFTRSFHACPLSRVSDADMCICILFVTLLV